MEQSCADKIFVCFVLGFYLDSFICRVTILGGLNHRQRRIQLQGKLFMVYFMKTLPSMYYLSFGCCFFSLQCRARRFSIDVQTLHLRRGCIFLHYLHWFNMICDLTLCYWPLFDADTTSMTRKHEQHDQHARWNRCSLFEFKFLPFLQ